MARTPRQPVAAMLLGALAVLLAPEAVMGGFSGTGGAAAARGTHPQRPWRLLRSVDAAPRAPGAAPDDPGPRAAVLPPAAYAAALPRCQLQRQTLRGGAEALVTIDCRTLAPGLDAPRSSLPVKLTQSFIHGFDGVSSALLDGLAPLLVTGQPLEGQVAALRLLPGSDALLSNLAIVNATLGAPADLAGSLRMAWLDDEPAAATALSDVRIFTSGEAVAAYAAHLQRVTDGTPLPLRPAFYTDNRTFVHINSWVAPSGVRATGVGLLALGAGDEQLAQPLAHTPLNPPAPVVLSATNATLVRLLRQHAGVDTPVPLLVYITTNVTLGGGTSAQDSSPAGGAAPAPPGPVLLPGQNITVARPLILVGSRANFTGIDFRMRVNQLVLTGRHGNLTLDSLVLENLGFGDAVTARTIAMLRNVDADMATSNSMWAVWYQRTTMRLTLRNCTSVVPPSEADFTLYWGAQFTAGSPSASWMRDVVGVVAFQVTSVPEGYWVADMRGVGLHEFDTLLVSTNRIAPQLPWPPSAEEAPVGPGSAGQAPKLLSAVRSADAFWASLASPPRAAGRAQLVLLIEPHKHVAPQRGARAPPPGGLLLPGPVVISGITAGSTTLDLGVGGGGAGAAQAQHLLQLPTNASASHLVVTLVTLTGLGTRPLLPVPGDGSALRGSAADAALSSGGGGGIAGSGANARQLLQAPLAGTVGSGEQGGPVPPALPHAGCWTLLLWAVQRDMSSTPGSEPLELTAAALVLQRVEFDAVARHARDSGSFDIQPDGSEELLRFANVSIRSGGEQVVVGNLSGFGMRFSNVALEPDGESAEAARDSPGCRWPPAASGAAAAPPGSGPWPFTAAVAAAVCVSAPLLAGAGGLIWRRRRRKLVAGIEGNAVKAPSVAATVGSSAVQRQGSGMEGGDTGLRSLDRSGSSGVGSGTGWRKLSAAIGSLSVELQQRRVAAGLGVAAPAGHAEKRRPASSAARSDSLLSASVDAYAGSSQPSSSMPSVGVQANSALQPSSLHLHVVLGRGTFGQVWRATWKGATVAVKVMTLPPAQAPGGGGDSCMAVREAAISTSVSHPNVVQVFSYQLKPVAAQEPQVDAPYTGLAILRSGSSSLTTSSPRAGRAAGDADAASSDMQPPVVGWELRLIMEYCELGSLRDALDTGCLRDPLGVTHVRLVAGLAHQVACAMLHLHSDGILHGDLKASNVLLRAAPDGVAVPTLQVAGPLLGVGRTTTTSSRVRGSTPAQRLRAAMTTPGAGLLAKVADFGLSHAMQPLDTHVSNTHAGTLTHMAPELLVEGRMSRASDVYAFGVTIWELATGGRPFAGVASPLIGHQVTTLRRRPTWPSQLCPASIMLASADATPSDAAIARVRAKLVLLVERCWAHAAPDRPHFGEIAEQLAAMTLELKQHAYSRQGSSGTSDSNQALPAPESVVLAAGGVTAALPDPCAAAAPCSRGLGAPSPAAGPSPAGLALRPAGVLAHALASGAAQPPGSGGASASQQQPAAPRVAAPAVRGSTP